MIIGLGVDLIEVRRMEELLRHHPRRARERLFTASEREFCESRPESGESFAVRYAAKEACLKALGTGLGRGVGWQDIEVRTDDLGRPSITLSGRARERMEALGGSTVHVSLSHDAGFAVAVVAIEA